MVGSSWNRAESSGLAPIRSPAATNTLFFFFLSAQLLDQRCHMLGPAGGDRDPPALVLRVQDWRILCRPAAACRLP